LGPVERQGMRVGAEGSVMWSQLLEEGMWQEKAKPKGK